MLNAKLSELNTFLQKIFLKKKIATTIFLLFTFITGCAGTITGISEQNRDTTGTYDGVWNVDVQKSAGIQYYGKWQMNCGDMRTTFNVRVNDGAMTLNNAADAPKGFVSKDGIFRLTVPLDAKSKATGNSSITMSNGDTQLILTGKLVPNGESSKGHITYGVAELGYGGCTAKTKYALAK